MLFLNSIVWLVWRHRNSIHIYDIYSSPG